MDSVSRKADNASVVSGNFQLHNEKLVTPITHPFAHLCHFCQHILNKNKPYHYDIEYMWHYDDESSFRASADQGCNLCLQFLNGGCSLKHWLDVFGPYKPEKTWATRRGGLLLVRAKKTLELIIPFVERPVNFGKGSGYEGKHMVFTVEICKVPAQARTYYNGTGDQSSTSTKDGMPQLKQWYKECLKTHVNCNPVNGPLLTRLISLGSDNIRLILSNTIQGEIKYATLSHCWGTQRQQTLLSSNITEFQERIPSCSLSKTFIDAIEIARYFGFQYLWIDSLCIIQDSIGDWKKESVLMCDVYGGSSLNIAASGAADGKTGCFFPRSSKWRCQIESPTPGDNTILECYSPVTLNALKSSKLSERGWIIQERVLSHRTIHFTEKQLYWECRHHVKCETFVDQAPENDLLGDCYRRPLTGGMLTAENWTKLVEGYSRCHLTYEKDKLVAISGLAKYMHPIIKDDYIAGMWRGSIAEQLCWHIRGNLDVQTRRHSEYVAPSWSWASINTASKGVTFREQSQIPSESFITIDRIAIDYCTDDHFGAISSAIMRLCCEVVFRATLYPFAEPREEFVSPVFVKADGVTLVASQVYLDYISLYWKESIDVYLVPILDLTPKGSSVVNGIVCRASTEKKLERIGFFTTNFSAESSLGRLYQENDRKWKDLGESEYADIVVKGGEKLCMIDII